MASPDETGRHAAIPRSTEGAHARIDVLRDDHGQLRRRVDEIEVAFGEEPMPLQKKPGSGMMLTLSEIEKTHSRRQALDEQSVQLSEKWRLRWTVLAAIATVLLAGGSLLEKILAALAHH